MKKRITAGVLTLSVLLSLLAGCGRNSAADIPTEPPTQPTVAETVPADGNPEDVTCLGSYTADVSNPADTVVASVGSAELTAGQLQVYYWLEVAAHRQAAGELSPDFSRPLDTQPCEIDSSVNSWQQYFLKQALNTWHAHQSLILLSQERPVPTEEAYQPNMEQYAKYMPEVPALQYLYGYRQYFQPNEQHQAYLDALPETLSSMALRCGFSNDSTQAAAVAGPAATTADIRFYAQTANYAYMYLTELGYEFSPTTEEITAHYDAGNVVAGSKDQGNTVNMRHILLIPQNAEVAADGTVTADADSWNACYEKANSILHTWQSAVKKTPHPTKVPMAPAESRFAELAKDHSADPGSATSGGLYQNLKQGQLTDVLDSWCFDPVRQYGDVEILQSDFGYHIVFFVSSTPGWYNAAKEDLIRDYYARQILSAKERFPMEVSYSSIRLGHAEDNGSFLLPSDFLYPDVAHQRYPSIPLYIQQDYPESMYGFYKLATHGCGICVLAMVASYMTDEEYTPAELGEIYGFYCGKRGSDIMILDNSPAEMGFFLDKRAHNWDEIDAALQNGQPVATLQHPGYWTRGGHFILMTKLTADGKYQVRDSNLFNYARLPAFAEDCHTRGSIRAAGQFYWIFEKKVTSIAACVRCGGEERQNVPAGLVQDYQCPKCLNALIRRNSFLNSPQK